MRFDRIQSFSDEPVKVCPECEGETQRLIQPAGIIFKGSGFYVNDSRSSRKNLTNQSSKDKDSSDDTKSKKNSTEKKAKKTTSTDD